MKTIPIACCLLSLSIAAGAQDLSGCNPAIDAAVSLKSVADDHDQQAARHAWQDLRDLNEMPVWHSVALESLMQMSLSEMTIDQVSAVVQARCTAEFEAFATRAADVSNDILSAGED